MLWWMIGLMFGLGFFCYAKSSYHVVLMVAATALALLGQ